MSFGNHLELFSISARLMFVASSERKIGVPSKDGIRSKYDDM